MASYPQLSRARSPFGSVSERGPEAAPKVRPAPSQDPAPSLGLVAGRRLQTTSGDFGHRRGAPKGNQRPLDLRVHIAGWGAHICAPRSPPTPRPVRSPPLLAGREGQWELVCWLGASFALVRGG